MCLTLRILRTFTSTSEVCAYCKNTHCKSSNEDGIARSVDENLGTIVNFLACEFLEDDATFTSNLVSVTAASHGAFSKDDLMPALPDAYVSKL